MKPIERITSAPARKLLLIVGGRHCGGKNPRTYPPTARHQLGDTHYLDLWRGKFRHTA